MKNTKLWLVLAVGAAVIACNMAPFPIQAERFACQADSECASTNVCIDGECRVPGVGPGGDGGTGTPDAGNRTDAGTTDAGTTDAGTTDAGVTDAGSCTPTAEVCGDGVDNDCDTNVDCADTQCNQQSCGTACVCEGGTARELTCDDGEDNDKDGTKDCEDSDCSAHSCGTGCVCSSQVKAEAACADGSDNDADLLTDCMDPDCAGESINGVVCTGASSGNERGQSEGSCYISTASDNDGDTRPNCEDPDCWGRACTLSGSCFCHNGVPREILCDGAADDDKDLKNDSQDPDCCGATGGVAMAAGVCTAIETNCYDGQDNNGTDGIDCADPTCGGRACNSAGTCVCTEGAKHEISLSSSVVACDVGVAAPTGDEDGDGLANCADPDCNSKLCSGSGCYCVGTTPVETSCSDGKDNDKDGKMDCADPDCVNATSSANGVVCADLKPTCSGNGGLTDTGNELMCSDGFDNNCNGQKDGSDLACTVTSEANCSNGTDDDGDGKADCEDSDCQGHTCVAGSSASVCCGVGPNATQCKDITQDEGNCGGCGVSCSSGEQCQPVTAGGVTSGQCTCSSAGCPTSGGGITEAQTCSGGLCICTGTGSAGQCATNAACTAREGLTSASAGFCHYP